MWPGQQQPPGGEPNPTGQNPQGTNPYQQSAYQQPNPYQQPGYQQTAPHGQPAQWDAPTQPGGPQAPGGGGGKGNRTKLVAILSATAVVIAAGVTGFLVLGGDKDEQAKNDPKPKKSAGTLKDPGPSPSDDGRSADDATPMIEGWKVVVNPKFGTAFDVPPEWQVVNSDTSVGFEYEVDGESTATTVNHPAYLKEKWCTSDEDKDGRKEETSLATAGTRGERGAKSTEQAAETRVPWWIFGGYTQPDKKSVKQDKPKDYTTKSGLTGSVATAHSEGTPQKGKCDSEGKAITFAFQNRAGDYVTWNLYGAKGVKDEIPDETVQKILSTVRLSEGDPTS